MLAPGDVPGPSCECGSKLEFSYIWIANSTQSTVSKLNTVTMEEEGRYLTHPTSNGSPSRTSVSIDGRAVAVANRNGGVVKVLARNEECDEMNNGQPGLQTSSDSNFLPWDQDDCVEWFQPFNYTTQRPVAWGPGTLNEETCAYEDQTVWTAGCAVGGQTWVTVTRLDGDTGMILDEAEVPGFECSSLSPYGGAVDPEGNFWFTNLVPGQDRMAKIDVDTFESTVWNIPITPYGMTVDSKGRVWAAAWLSNQNSSAARFDPETEQWAYANNHVAYSMSGIQEDSEGRMWMNYWNYDGDSSNPGLTYIDADTMEVGPAFGINCGASACRGISVDLDQNVWSTSSNQNMAFRFNPETEEITTYNQLVSPYTYSDMTGWAIQNTSCDPTG